MNRLKTWRAVPRLAAIHYPDDNFIAHLPHMKHICASEYKQISKLVLTKVLNTDKLQLMGFNCVVIYPKGRR